KGLNVYKAVPFYLEALRINDCVLHFFLKVTVINENAFSLNDNSNTIAFGKEFTNQNGTFRLVKTGIFVQGSEYTVAYSAPERQAAALIKGLSIQPRSTGTGILSISMQSTNARMSADIVNALMVEYDSMTI